MPLSKADLQIQQGADYAGTVTVAYTDGSPLDLTGWTAQSQLRKGIADCNAEVIYEIGTTILAPDKVILNIPNAVTTTLKGRYAWDLDLTNPEGGITTIMAGNADVRAEVTR